MSTLTASTPVKRACDSCHRRKVKCIGEGTNPCKNCVSAGLACTYNAIPQKKGPKGSRAKVLSELRESQRNAQLAAGLSHELGFDGRALPTTFARTSGLLPPALVDSCIEFFFANVYPSQPILQRQRVQEIVMSIGHSTEAYCLIVALCAYVMIQANMTVSPNLLPRPEMAQLSNVSLGHVLLEEATRVRKGYDYLEDPTHLSILTSWFSYGCYFGLGRDNTSWSFLREATTQAQLLGLHDEETYKTDPLDISRKRVLYWLLFVAERTHALHKHRPISLYPTIHPPSLDEVPSDRPVAAGLDLLINLYKPVDDTFVHLWNKVRTHANPTWIAQIQNQLSEALPTYLECTESQAVDLRVTQQWLRTMLWQLCVSQGLVSSVAADNSLTFKYPIEISRDLLSMTHQFSRHVMEVHGVGLVSTGIFRGAIHSKFPVEPGNPCYILLSLVAPPPQHLISDARPPCQGLDLVAALHANRSSWHYFLCFVVRLTWLQIEKLFDIACCLTDVVACIPFSPDTFALGPRDYVSRFLTLFSALRGGQTRYLQLLLAKVSEVLPNLPLPRSLNVPQNIPTSTIGLGPGTLGTVPSNMADDISSLPTVSSPSHPSTELIRQLAAQTGAQLPFSTSQQSLLQAPSSRVEDLSLYDTSAPHSAHSSGSAPPSQSGTPGPYESTNQSRTQLPAQSHGHAAPQVPSSHPQHGQMQGHQLGIGPTAYDPRFTVQGFPVDPSMVFKQDDAESAGQMQCQGALYAHHGAGRGGLGHGRGHGGGYAG